MTISSRRGPIIRLAGLRSRWMTPRSWANWIVRATLRVIFEARIGLTARRAHDLRQGPAVDEGQHDERKPVGLAEVENPADIRMVELGRGLGLLEEAAERFLVPEVERGLDRDVPRQPRVPGPRDDAHPASPEFLDDLVPPGEERHGRGGRPGVRATRRRVGIAARPR